MTVGEVGIGSGFALGTVGLVLGTLYLPAALRLRRLKRRAIVLGVSGGLIATPCALFLSLVLGGSLGGSLGGLVGEWVGAPSDGAAVGLAIGVGFVFCTTMLAGVSLGLLASTWISRHTGQANART